MGLLTFDPDRVSMLSRALTDVSERIDTCLRMSLPDEIADDLRHARGICELQLDRVGDALRDIAAGRLKGAIPCWHVDSLVRHFEIWADETEHWWTLATTKDSTRADDIVRTLECNSDPRRSGDLIDSLEHLQYLVFGTVDLARLETIWQEATDPMTTPSAIALGRIRRLLDVVFDGRPWERGIASGPIDSAQRNKRESEIHAMAARIVAPWQIEILVPTYGSTYEMEGVMRLHRMSELRAAADALMIGLPDAVRRSLTVLPDDAHDRRLHIDAVARAIGTVLEVHRLSDIERSEERSGFDTLRSILATLSLDGPWPISILVDAGARWIGDYLDSSEAGIRTATMETLVQREVLATIAVLSVWNAALARSRRATSQSNSTRAQPPADLAPELQYTYQAIDNAAGRGQALAQITAS